MSTVLEKAVLLDETGQLIVDKLDDIKEAIGNSGEYIPLAIRVTTPPTKVSYYDGDALDLFGIVVSLVGSNGSLIDVTSACTFSPANGATLSTSDTSVAITYHYAPDNVDFTTSQEITVAGVAPVSIAVTTPPTKTEYIVGDTLDLTGIAVTATYNNGTTSDVTASCTYSPANGATLSSADVDTVNISYTDSGTTLTTTQTISVTYPIYGAEWDGTADPTWSRTDLARDFVDPVPECIKGSETLAAGSSPFDNIMPWSGMEVVEDTNGGSLVKIPKFYYKWTIDGTKMKLQISMVKADGFETSPAHQDRGDGQGERDFVYVGRFRTAETTYKSESANGSYSTTLANARGTTRNRLGSEFFLRDYHMYWTIGMLMIVEFGTWDITAFLGKLPFNVDRSSYYSRMNYHTSWLQNNSSVTQFNQYRYIVAPCGINGSEWIDGVYMQDQAYPDRKQFKIQNNPNDYGTTNNLLLVATLEGLGVGNNVTKKWGFSEENAIKWACSPVEYQLDSTFSSYSCGNTDVGKTTSGSASVNLTMPNYGNDGSNYFAMIKSDGSSANKCYRIQKLPNNS